jgi:hypothetical protein
LVRFQVLTATSMEVVSSSERLVSICQTRLRNISEDSHFQHFCLFVCMAYYSWVIQFLLVIFGQNRHNILHFQTNQHCSCVCLKLKLCYWNWHKSSIIIMDSCTEVSICENLIPLLFWLTNYNMNSNDIWITEIQLLVL